MLAGLGTMQWAFSFFSQVVARLTYAFGRLVSRLSPSVSKEPQNLTDCTLMLKIRTPNKAEQLPLQNFEPPTRDSTLPLEMWKKRNDLDDMAEQKMTD